MELRKVMILAGYTAAVIGLIAGVATWVYASTVDEAEVVEVSRQGGLIIIGMLFVTLATVLVQTAERLSQKEKPRAEE